MTIHQTKDPAFAFSLLDFLPDAIIWVRPVFNDADQVEDFEVAYSNKAADIGMNHPKGSLAGLYMLRDGVPSRESAESNFKHYLDVYQTGEIREYSFFAHHANRQFETVRRPFEGGVLSTTRDRRAQREAEKKVEQTSRVLQSIVDSSPNGIAVYEAMRDKGGNIYDFKVRLYNERSNELMGFTADERPNLTLRSILERLQAESFFDRYVEVVERGTTLQREQFVARTQKWLSNTTVKLDDGFLVTLTDITESRRDKENMERAAQRFETVVNTSKAGMFTLIPVKDERGEVIDFHFGLVNQAVASYIGQTADVLKGALASMYFPAYQTNGLFDIYKDNYLTGTPYNFDFHYEDGYDVFFNIDVVKVGDEVLVTFTDHTTLKRLQRTLEAKMEELRRSNTNLEEFAHAASHDLKEPIRKVQTFASRLRFSLQSRINESEASLFERMTLATERMHQLVDDLLQYSQVSFTSQQKEEVDLNERLRQVLSDLEVQIEEKRATITVGPLPTVKGYGRQLQQLFQNLISNALKYSQPGVPPQITVQARIVKALDVPQRLSAEPGDKEFDLIEVQDNGIGFEQQYAERIFQMFQRLHGRSEYAGTGVGLSIVQKVAENHEGYVTAESEPGQGATFRIYFPK